MTRWKERRWREKEGKKKEWKWRYKNGDMRDERKGERRKGQGGRKWKEVEEDVVMTVRDKMEKVVIARKGKEGGLRLQGRKGNSRFERV